MLIDRFGSLAGLDLMNNLPSLHRLSASHNAHSLRLDDRRWPFLPSGQATTAPCKPHHRAQTPAFGLTRQIKPLPIAPAFCVRMASIERFASPGRQLPPAPASQVKTICQPLHPSSLPVITNFQPSSKARKLSATSATS